MKKKSLNITQLPSRRSNQDSGATPFFRNHAHVVYVIKSEKYSRANDYRNLSGTLLIHVSVLLKIVPGRRVSGPMTDYDRAYPKP